MKHTSSFLVLKLLVNFSERLQRPGQESLKNWVINQINNIASNISEDYLSRISAEYDYRFKEQENLVGSANKVFLDQVKQVSIDVCQSFDNNTDLKIISTDRTLSDQYYSLLIARKADLLFPEEVAKLISDQYLQNSGKELESSGKLTTGLNLQTTIALLGKKITSLKNNRTDLYEQVRKKVYHHQQFVKDRLNSLLAESITLTKSGDLKDNTIIDSAIKKELPESLTLLFDKLQPGSSRNAALTTLHNKISDHIEHLDFANLIDQEPEETEIEGAIRAGIKTELDQVRHRYNTQFTPDYARAYADRRRAEQRIWAVDSDEGVPWNELQKAGAVRRINRDIINGRYVMVMCENGEIKVRLARGGEENPTAPFHCLGPSSTLAPLRFSLFDT